ncbi:MAG: TonB-dependent receptor [Bacteroides sp.]|nr:TonB-dependent receptor [Bacteroides sp.]
MSQVQTAMSGAMQNLATGWNAQMNASNWTSTPNFYGDTTAAVSQVLTGIMKNAQVAGLLQMLGMTSEQVLAQLSSGVGSSLSALQQYSAVSIPSDYQENSTNYATNQAADIFADFTWRIYRGLSFTAGLRGTYEHQKTGYSSTSDVAPIYDKSILYQTSDGEKVWASGDYYSWVGRAALNCMFGRNNVYASVSRGRRPGVISFNNTPDEITRLKPEIIVSYEAGVKGNVLKNRLGYEFSVFYYDWSHFQSSRLVSDENGTKKYVADDAGKAHSLGFEAGLRYSFTSNIHVFGNYAYIDGKFSDTDGDGREQELAGNRFRLTPKSSFALGVDANIPLNKSAMFYVRPSYSYKSKVYFENENSELLSQDGYGVLNCNLGLQWKPKKVYYEVGLFGKNILNEEYLIDAGNSGNQIGFPTFVAGSPSIFGVSLKVGF